MSCMGVVNEFVRKLDIEAFEDMISVVGWIAGVPNQSQKSINFITKYKNEFGYEPDELAASFYDAAFFLAEAIAAVGSIEDKESIRNYIATKEFEGIQGKIKFDQRGIWNKPSIVTITDSEGNFHILK